MGEFVVGINVINEVGTDVVGLYVVGLGVQPFVVHATPFSATVCIIQKSEPAVP